MVVFPGAGSSSQHRSLLVLEERLSPLPVERCDFPYRIAGRGFPDKPAVLLESVRSHVRRVADSLGVPTTSLVIGGRSMGGRICSMAVADRDDPLDVAGLVLISYPLHPPGKPDRPRTAHLDGIDVPTLCVSGTKDSFGDPISLRAAFAVVPAPVEWVLIDGARHELAGKDEQVADTVAAWISSLAAARDRRPR